MSERRRVNLSLSMASPLQREAWKVLRSIPPGQRTDAVCRMICRSKEKRELLESIRAIFQEEFRRNNIISTEKQGPEAEDADENVLGFLLSLQNDGGDATDPLL